MNTVTIIIIVVVVLVLAGAAAAAVYQRRRRSTALKERFGPEYNRTVEAHDDRRRAEKELEEREKRRAGLEVSPLSASSAARYRDEWDDVQRRFVDEPAEAVERADRLVVRMMRECGYPVDDFDQRAADISVDHPDVAQHYREAHEVAVAQARGAVDTEKARQAVTSYRQLVEALLKDSAADEDASRSRRTDEQPEGT